MEDQAERQSRIEDAVAPRVIEGEQRTALVNTLKVGAKGDVGIVSVAGDRESLDFAHQIQQILKDSGWCVCSFTPTPFSPANPVGLLMRVKEKGVEPPRAISVQRAFESVGIEVSTEEDPGLAEDALVLVVGVKPTSE